MAYATASDGTRLYYEEAGSGTPILFVHEFAGDYRSWEPQIRHFARRYRCIVYNARGYPPSDVPPDVSAYSQQQAVEDAVAVLDAAGIERAHVVGLSMGGFCTLHLGLRHPERALSLVVAGCGYGAQPEKQEGFRAESAAIADLIEAQGMPAFADRYAVGPARVQLQNKDPRGWDEFRRMLAEHSTTGSANTMRGVQRGRPSLYALTDQIAALRVATLIMTGDEDEGCLEPDLMLKRTIPASGLVILPKTGHTLNLEEPALFNQAVLDFITAVEAGAWGERDPRARSASTTGITKE